MSGTGQHRGQVSDWLTDRALRGLIACAMALPWERRVPAFGALLRRGIGPLAGYRKRAEENLAKIHPDLAAADRRHLADRVLDNFGRTLIENYSWQEFGRRLQDTEPQGPGLETLARAKAEGRPVLFVTGHFGNHEAPRQVLTRLGYSIGGLYRPMANPFFNSHYARTMTGMSGPVFEQGRRGTTGLMRHLKGGGMATLLFDVADRRGEMIDFLGRPAPTSLSAAELARRFDAPLIPYFGTRRADGLGFDVVVEEPVTPGEPLTMMQETTRRLEARVASHPDQWFWIHRRWKRPKRWKD